MYKSSGCDLVCHTISGQHCQPNTEDKMGEIGLINFKIGQAIQAGYTNASDGRLILGFADANDNLLFHFAVRYESKVLILNTRKDGKWGPEVRPSGYDFTPEKSITVELLTTETYISISIDGKHFYDFNYREGLPITSATKVYCQWILGSGIPAKIQYLTVKF